MSPVLKGRHDAGMSLLICRDVTGNPVLNRECNHDKCRTIQCWHESRALGCENAHSHQSIMDKGQSYLAKAVKGI